MNSEWYRGRRLVRQCYGKLKHRDWKTALDHAGSLRREENEETGKFVCIYGCENCGFLHVGHSKWIQSVPENMIEDTGDQIIRKELVSKMNQWGWELSVK